MGGWGGGRGGEITTASHCPLSLGRMKFGVVVCLRMYCVMMGRRGCVSHAQLRCKSQGLRKSCERRCSRNLKRQNDVNVHNPM